MKPATLRKLEWAGRGVSSGEPVCIVCGGYKFDGHAPDCELDAAIREAEQAEKGERPEIRVGDVLADHISVFRIDNAEEAEFWQQHTDTLTALYRDPLWRQEPPTHD